MSLNIAILLSIFVLIRSGIVLGPSCYGICVTACCSLGASAFCKQAGCVFDIQGCGAMCMPICAAGRFIPTVCFASETTFANGTISIQELKVGRSVSGNTINKVIFVPGKWTFINILLRNQDETKFLSVTPEHGVYIKQRESLKKIPASELKLGDIMFSESGKQVAVVKLEYQEKDGKYWIDADSEQIYASGVLTTKGCYLTENLE